MVRSPSASAAGLTAADLIIEAMERFSDRDAFVPGDQRVSYGRAADAISRIVRLLAARGVGPGRAVAALSPNMPEVWLVQAAAYLLGTTYTGLHPLGLPGDHAYVCDDAGIAVLVAHPKFAETGAALAERCPGIGRLLTLGPAEAGQDQDRGGAGGVRAGADAGYGQTECLGMCTNLRKDEHDPERRSGLLASCGRPVAGARAEVQAPGRAR